MELDLFSSAFLAILSLLLGGILHWSYSISKIGGYNNLARQILDRAESDAEILRKEAAISIKQIELEQKQKLDEERQKDRKKIEREEERLKKREDKLEQRMSTLEKRLSDAQNLENELQHKEQELSKEIASFQVKLSSLSNLDPKETKELLFKELSLELKDEVASRVRKAKETADRDAELQAQQILSTTIQRLAVPCVAESTITSVSLPSDEIKGRIIGKEGRNIKTFEKLTGVSVMMDDTPGSIVLSCFDPIRKQIAKTALGFLLKGNRFHPTRIEECVEQAEKEVENQIRKSGENAAFRAHASDLDPELIKLLGRLSFRYSLGQNILEHSLEVSYILGMLAAELSLDEQLARRIGLLHDIGKAVSHEEGGSHVLVGSQLAAKYGEHPDVVNGIACHHGEVEPTTIEGSLCGTADAISASRPGARIEAIEDYVKRQNQLEEIALNFPGVEQAFILQAGRELQVSVKPTEIDDDGILLLARQIARKIEEEFKFPGKIKVSVIRETRGVQYAL